jgi:hypothetical protein
MGQTLKKSNREMLTQCRSDQCARMMLPLCAFQELRYKEDKVLPTSTLKRFGGTNMALSWSWRRLKNFRRWKKATTPVLLNAETGELISFSGYTAPPDGKWMLRRPLTLPGSPVPLFLEARSIPVRTKRSDVKSAVPNSSSP